MSTTAPAACVSFQVLPGTYRVASACGLEALDSLELWRQACPNIDCPDDGTDCWTQFRPQGAVVTLTELKNPMMVDTPGNYRLVFAGPTNTDVTVCVSDAIEGTSRYGV